MRVVLDTNTLVSAIGWAGPPRDVLLALREGRHQLITTAELLAELERVLRYPKLAPVRSHPALPLVLAWLYRPEHLVVPQERVQVIREDPADNRVLEAALAGRAGAVVSGDRHLLRLSRYQDIEIVTARDFCDRYL
ncbi:Nucleotide binding protein PINc [Thermaerobacter marianensis DSM 12885]|uniref:Nucleotide binding protein PINc n=1 Tax=Thermaerobacter marianensis (strain ATCC 700841 / DSM 12885 / JCM 10246 / 7p75a) TaxID=644966 RepID=E6SI50_THEM7|nr:putative toxin-antitoxin system toxin component, PIN family [Thermaerobacter marianensis]ADU50828.1 Nucleotide binding protein PINc [Thermaerobacter marianensis DSM 12885]